MRIERAPSLLNVLHCLGRSVCVLPHIEVEFDGLGSLGPTAITLGQLTGEELGVIFAGVVAAAWLTPT